MNVIEKIESLRKARDWSVNKLAMEAMIPQSTLSSILQRKASLNIDTLEHICEGFGITLAQFFIDNEKTESVTALEKVLLENFRKMSKEKKQALIDLLAN